MMGFSKPSIFFTTSILPTISGNTIENNEKQNMKSQKLVEEQDDVEVTFYSFGLHEQSTKEIKMSYNEVEKLLSKISGYSTEIAYDSRSGEAQELQQEIFALTDELGLLPESISTKTIQTEYNPLINIQNTRNRPIPILQNRASAFFCNFATTGTGSQFPIIIFPRLIPIIQLPIPRVFLRWTATEGITSCGGLLSGKGFIAYGQQKGLALGFWGIGFSVFLPPIMQYGFIGYALYASAEAEVIELWPPNTPPTISPIGPYDGEINVPLSLSELQFQISDFDGDLMSYTVTTTPDVGSGSGNLKPDGVYSVSISGLEDLTEYTWHIEVTDGMDTTIDDFTFITEAVAPIISNPLPEDGARNVPVDLSHLSFHLKDFQGDPMDYTVETVPDIGSGDGTGVGEGIYTVDVNVDYDMDYIWYVNVTDGTHWTNEVYSFKTRPVPGSWWNDNWTCRKEIIVDYTKVEGEFYDFPVSIHLDSDSDLAGKAQDDGDDIVFTDYSGTKLNHEIEFFDEDLGEVVVWVNVLSLNPDSILYLYYGNQNCNNQQNVEGTWDSNYIAVYHMDDATQTSVSDSTSNGFTGTKSEDGPNEQNGKIHKCQFFDGNDRIDTVDDSKWDVGGAITLSLWVAKSYKDTSFGAQIICHDASAYKYMIYASKATDNWTFYGTLPSGQINPGGHFSYGSTPQYIVGTFDRSLPSSRAKYYWNGVLIGQADGYDEDIINGDEGFTMGYGDGNFITDTWIDEVRISSIARSTEWISTEYNNQNDPSSFMDIGPEEPAS